VKKFINKCLAPRGYRLSKLTPENQIIELIKSLRANPSVMSLKRFGGDTDGGYLVPDDIAGISAIFSPGVGLVSSFEADLIDAIGTQCRVYMADASVEPPRDLPKTWHFSRSYLAAIDRSPYIRLETWVKGCAMEESSDLLLQMDIEGAEYLVLVDTPIEILQKFRIIVIEFHRLDLIFSSEIFELYSLVFSKLLSTHAVVHIHPNNNDGQLSMKGMQIPRTMEFTFLRKDRFVAVEGVQSYPHFLDRKNNPDKPDLVLPEIWT
jgi:hypothetical protein